MVLGCFRGIRWHHDWLWITFYTGYSATATPVMMQEYSVAQISGIVHVGVKNVCSLQLFLF